MIEERTAQAKIEPGTAQATPFHNFVYTLINFIDYRDHASPFCDDGDVFKSVLTTKAMLPDLTFRP